MNDQQNESKNTQTEPTPKEYKGDHVTVNVFQYPGCRTRFDMSVTPAGTQAAYKKAVKAINKEVSLPGFRKGKAPEAMIIQNYSTYVDQEWKEILVQTAFKDAMGLVELYPLNEKAIKKPQIKNAEKDEGAEITIEFEAVPRVPEVSPGDITLSKVEEKEVTQEQIEESLQNIRLHHAEWEDVEDRPVQEGDYIDVDIHDEDNPERTICKDTRFEVAEGKMGDWMRELVLGKNTGDVVKGKSAPSPDLDPSVDFQPTNCAITIKSVKQARLPEIDEALAEKVGLKTVDELKERVEANLRNQAKEEAQGKLRDQLEQAVLEKHSFEVPASLVDREVRNRIDKLKREMEKAGKTAEEVAKMIEQARPSVESEVKDAFQMFFISRKVADENNIEVSQEELVKELMLQMYTQSSALDSSLDPEEARSKVYISLLSQKVKDYLIDQAAVE